MGVGARLKEKFANVGVVSGNGCGCDSLAKSMDTAGVAWCRQHGDYILDKIRDNAKSLGLPYSRTAAAMFLESAIADEEDFIARKEEIAAKCFEDRVLMEIEDVNRGPQARESRWQLKPEVIEAHRRILGDKISAINKLERPPIGSADWFGPGIVTLGGSLRYFPSAFVLIFMLRSLGCKLPIECWYLDDHEFDPHMAEILESFGDVRCVNGLDRIAELGIEKPRCWGGWEAKAWSIQHSRFSEVLFLDADIVPARDPTDLFTADEFANYGYVTWPNYDHSVSYTASAAAFELLGLRVPPCDGRFEHHNKPNGYVAEETGQLLVNKERHWKAIEIAKALSDHSDFFYPSGFIHDEWHSYGDTATFMWGMACAGHGGTMIGRPCEMFGDDKGGGLNQHDFDGEVCWQHRTMPRFKVRVSSDNPATGLIQDLLFAEACRQARVHWNANIWDWQTQTPTELEIANQQIGDWFAQGFEGAKGRTRLLPNGRIEHGGRLRWRVFIKNDVPRLVIADTQRAAVMMEQHPNGWRNPDCHAILYHAAPQWWDGTATALKAHVWCDVVLHNEYRLPARLDGWDVLDIGANEGTFSHACFERGAKCVVSVEPDRLAYSRLVRNLDAREGSICFNAAAWRADKPDRMVSLVPWNESAAEDVSGAVSDGSGHQVRTVSIDQFVGYAALAKSFLLLKLDCEGSEFPLILSSRRLRSVNAIVAEVHAGMLWNRPDWWGVPRVRAEALQALEDALKAADFTYVLRMDHDNGNMGHLWAWRGECPFTL